MKKLLFGAVALFIVSCNSNTNSSNLPDKDNPSADDSISQIVSPDTPSEESLNKETQKKDVPETKAKPETVDADLQQIEANIKTFYDKAVLGDAPQANNRSFLQKYCTASFIKQLKAWAEEEGGSGYATVYLCGLGNGGGYYGHVTSVKPVGDNQIKVEYKAQLDGMGPWLKGSQRFAMKYENGVWKINKVK